MSEITKITERLSTLAKQLSSLPYAERAAAREELAELEQVTLPQARAKDAESRRREALSELDKLEAERVAVYEASQKVNGRRNALESEYNNVTLRHRNSSDARTIAALLTELADVWEASEQLSHAEKGIAERMQALEVMA